jgi:hypothetical protein
MIIVRARLPPKALKKKLKLFRKHEGLNIKYTSSMMDDAVRNSKITARETFSKSDNQDQKGLAS